MYEKDEEKEREAFPKTGAWCASTLTHRPTLRQALPPFRSPARLTRSPTNSTPTTSSAFALGTLPSVCQSVSWDDGRKEGRIKA